jgi:NTP pyrophosphatase (non-canonical NTP hydrolase)
MDFKEYQQEAKLFAIYKDSVIYPALGLASEAGEVCGKVKKILRDSQGYYSPEDKKNISAELGDVLWYIANLASDLNIPLQDIAIENITKLQDRMSRNQIKGSGDNR